MKKQIAALALACLLLAGFAGCGAMPGTVVALGMGYHGALRTADGVACLWGENTDGQLGDGKRVRREAPVALQSFGAVQSLAAGGNHTLFVKADGTVWACGDNYEGQLGVPSVARLAAEPVQVAALTQAVQAAAGVAYSAVLLADGTVWSFGSNARGQLGTGVVSPRYDVPVQAKGLQGITAIAAQGSFTLALDENGAVWGFGSNTHSQLGGQASEAVPAPRKLEGLQNITAIAAGPTHSLFLQKDGTVWVLGAFANEIITAPRALKDWGRATAIAAGDGFSLARGRNGSVWLWSKAAPQEVAAQATGIAAGGSTGAFTKKDGAVFTFSGGDPAAVTQIFPTP